MCFTKYKVKRTKASAERSSSKLYEVFTSFSLLKIKLKSLKTDTFFLLYN